MKFQLYNIQIKTCLFIISFSVILAVNLNAQNNRLNNDIQIVKERAVASEQNFHLTIKPFVPDQIFSFDSSLNLKVKNNTAAHLLNNDLLTYNHAEFNFKMNPVLDSKVLYDLNERSIFSTYKLGLNVESSYKNKLFFSSDYFISMINNPDFNSIYADSAGIIPYYGKYLSKTDNFYMLSSFRGEFAYKASENIYLHIGNGKNFFGNGYRSLFLSDNSNSYPYFKLTADIWKIKYIWMAAKLKDIQLLNFDLETRLYDKAVFIHYFSFNISKGINFTFFESIVSNPYDREGRREGYESAYFNPLIFYRPVEFYTGSSDNSLMGIGLNVRFWKSVYLYTQFVLDDLVISSINDASGWWGNKFGFQTGLKSYQLFNIEGLFFRVELNMLRPYTYSHGEISSYNGISNLNYGNYTRGLAHPSGANFIEGITEIRLQTGRIFTHAEFIFAEKGLDTDSISYGSDIYRSYNLRPDDYGIEFLQGSTYSFFYTELGVSYLINPKFDLMFETGIRYRSIKTDIGRNENVIINIGISTKIFNEKNDYF